jgi:anion-transporting  ArsA/GET3 family ATPase
MTTAKPPMPPAQSPTTSTSADREPMLVGHGRKIMNEISNARHDVVLTKSDTETIIGLLTPGDEDPVMDALNRIEKLITDHTNQFAELNRRLTRIERQLGAARQ